MRVAVSKIGCLYVKIISLSCGNIHKNPLRRKDKSRYQNASLTVEASLAFPVFFFSVLYLIQMFLVLQAELSLGQAGIESARDAAAFAYAAGRLSDGEAVQAKKLFELFDKELVRDAAFTAVFYARGDKELQKRAGVAQQVGGLWVDTERENGEVRMRVYYSVKPSNVLFPDSGDYYCLRFLYRPWTGEGKQEKKPAQNGNGQEIKAYLADNATVYHLDKNCTYINIKVSAVFGDKVEQERNAGGGKYYPCEFCEPVAQKNVAVFITKYGTRFHGVSSCSAIERTPRECPLEEAKEKYRGCKKCCTQ